MRYCLRARYSSAGTAVSILVSPSLQFVSIEGKFCLLLGCGAIILCDIECVKSIYRIMTMLFWYE